MKKWMIVYDTYSRAVEKAAAAVQQYTEYAPLCFCQPNADYNTIYLGICKDQAGFRIEVSEYDEQNDSQQVKLIAQDPVQLLYAEADFENYYLPYARDAELPGVGGRYYFNRLFQEPLKPCFFETKARIRRRGLWTWGHKIYDYRRYIDNMVRLKLNTLIIWNDYPPVNIGDVIAYAHENGVQLFMGFAWGWDTTMPDISKWPQIADQVIEEYRRIYADIPCDGIYFQTFTEHSSDVMNGLVVAEAAVDLVNQISQAVLAHNPKLEILFGLHATSVLNRLDTFKRLDPRVSIIWEDVGAFPYHYMPAKVENFSETRKLNRQLQTLRSGGFGAVLKGVICLDWAAFQHQDGPFVMGCQSAADIEIPQRTKEVLREMQAFWLKYAGYAQELISDLNEDALITCLVEDGYFEKAINFPTAVYAQMLWDSTTPTQELLSQVAQRQDVEFF